MVCRTGLNSLVVKPRRNEEKRAICRGAAYGIMNKHRINVRETPGMTLKREREVYGRLSARAYHAVGFARVHAKSVSHKEVKQPPVLSLRIAPGAC
jgi:hypothetical protein